MLPKTGAESIDRIVTARHVFSKIELRQKLRSCQRRCRLGLLLVGARYLGLRVLPQSPIDGLAKRQRFLCGCCESPIQRKKGKPRDR
jgi:hypothetical protein